MMCFNLNIIFIFNLMLSKLTIASNSIDSTMFGAVENRRNTKAVVLKSLVTSSKIQCTHRCKRNDKCQNINYNIQTGECELLGKIINKQQVKEVEDEESWINAVPMVKNHCEIYKAKKTCAISFSQVDIKRSNLLMTFPIWSSNWKIKFDVTLLGKVGGWTSLLHITQGGEGQVYGDRTPAFFFKPSSFEMEIGSAVNGHATYPYSWTIPMRAKTTIEVAQVQYDLEDGIHQYSITINGTRIHSVINNDARQFVNVKVYAGDPWYKATNAVINDLMIMNYL